MASYTSSSSFGGRSSFSDGSSDMSTSPTIARGGLHEHMSQAGQLPKFDEEGAGGAEPLDHPVLSSFNRDVVVAGDFGLAKMQTKSAWEKQMAAFDKEDLKKAKKEARKAKHMKVVAVPETKASKKQRKKAGEYDDVLDD